MYALSPCPVLKVSPKKCICNSFGMLIIGHIFFKSIYRIHITVLWKCEMFLVMKMLLLNQHSCFNLSFEWRTFLLTFWRCIGMCSFCCFSLSLIGNHHYASSAIIHDYSSHIQINISEFRKTGNVCIGKARICTDSVLTVKTFLVLSPSLLSLLLLVLALTPSSRSSLPPPSARSRGFAAASRQRAGAEDRHAGRGREQPQQPDRVVQLLLPRQLLPQRGLRAQAALDGRDRGGAVRDGERQRTHVILCGFPRCPALRRAGLAC